MDRVILHTIMHHSSTSTYIPTYVAHTFFALTLTYDLEFQSQASCGHDPHTQTLKFKGQSLKSKKLFVDDERTYGWTFETHFISSTQTSRPKNGKGFPYSLPSTGPGADPSVQAVSPQVTISHPPGGRLPLLSARPPVTFPAAEHHRPLAGTKLYCLLTEAHRCEQLAQGC